MVQHGLLQFCWVFCCTIDRNLTAFADINSADAYNEYATVITNFGLAAGRGAAVVNNIEYTKAEDDPAVLGSLEEIPCVFPI